MKNRFSRMGNTLLGAMCLLSTCGLTYSCSDDYDLDETMPSYLGGSIYDELKARNFTNVVRLIDDLDYKNVLSKTGSKTLFVAPDSAYNRFFATTQWKDASGNPVRSYEQLTTAQKRILLYGSMLNNAQVLEMLSYSSGDGSLTMRRSTAASAIDSVTLWKWNELPENLNEPEIQTDGSSIGDIRFWDAFRTQERGSVLMATDATSPMMVHFAEDQMKEKHITHSDVGFIMGTTWADGAEGGKRTYIYDAMVIEPNVTCMNGYFNVLDKVLVTPPNMAEVIRNYPQTSYFSEMLDRFSAPYYNYELTMNYKALYDIGNDSVYEKRYIASRTHTSTYTGSSGAMEKMPDEKSLPAEQAFLTFDPGWNEYAISSSTKKEHDMGVIYAPSNAAIEEYFVRGAGRGLMNRYAKLDNTPENLRYNLYQIPLDIIASLLNNLMKDSFNETVPSKYLTIMNDAQDQMFPKSNYSTQQAYEDCIDTTMLATNGLVYVLDRVIAPADYASVVAPALYSKNTQIIKTVVRGDDKYIEGSNAYNASPFKKYYSTYLKAMQSHFSFFIPTDEGLGSYGYVDPMSIAIGPAGAGSKYRYWQFKYKTATGAVIPIEAEAKLYNFETGQRPDTDKQPAGGVNNISKVTDNLSNGTGAIKRSLLIDIVDQHIIVHDSVDSRNRPEDGVFVDRRYFVSRTGAPVYIYKPSTFEKKGVDMEVTGGFQLQLLGDEYTGNDDCVSKVIEGYDMTEATNGYGNGMTYILDRPMQPTTNSVWKVMQNRPEFSEFFEICQSAIDEQILKYVGLNMLNDSTEMEDDEWKSERNKYRVFYEGVTSSTSAGSYPAEGEQIIRFFNNYRYTIYVPTNDAMQRAYANGLPKASEITEFVNNNLEQLVDKDGESYMGLNAANKAKAKAMITMLYNFVKYHFQDESLYVDNVTKPNTEYQTSCIYAKDDDSEAVYLSLSAKQAPGSIEVTDLNNNTQNVVQPYNLLARDAVYNRSPKVTATEIKSSSYVALHQVGEVLNFYPVGNGRYDAQWATPSQARTFAAKYRIRK